MQDIKEPNQLPHPKRILFQIENVQIGWKSSGRKWFVGAGMLNVENSCYLNSILQALFHVPAVANWLMSDSAHREKCKDDSGSQDGCIICAMSKTLIASQSSQNAILPYRVYTKLSQVCKHFIMGRQEDAHEFLRYLIEAMEKSYLARFRHCYLELNQFSKETTPLNQIFGGYLKLAVRCLACGHISTTFRHFEDLSLDIGKSNTIEGALEEYFLLERLEDCKCETCENKVAATKQFSLERAPISLCIQLKRFSTTGTKLNKHVTICPHLDLAPYSSKKNQEKLTYKLVSMVTHLGTSQHAGHYIAIGLTDAGGYYEFDDSSVRKISIQNVIDANAYIIFYELESSTQLHLQTSTQISKVSNNNNENIGPSDRQTTSTNSSSSLLHLNSKVISKLENNAGKKHLPQLPGKSTILKNDNNKNELSAIRSDFASNISNKESVLENYVEDSDENQTTKQNSGNVIRSEPSNSFDRTDAIAENQLVEHIYVVFDELQETCSSSEVSNFSNKTANQCEICKKNFPVPSKLKRHMTTHSDAKLFNCKICPKSYKSQRSLMVHIHKYHKHLYNNNN